MQAYAKFAPHRLSVVVVAAAAAAVAVERPVF